MMELEEFYDDEEESPKHNTKLDCKIITFLTKKIKERDGMMPYKTLVGYLSQATFRLKDSLDKYLEKQKRYFLIKDENVYLTGYHLQIGNYKNNSKLLCVRGEIIDKNSIRLVTGEIVIIPHEKNKKTVKIIENDINKGDIVVCDSKKYKDGRRKVKKLKVIMKCENSDTFDEEKEIAKFVTKIIRAKKGMIQQKKLMGHLSQIKYRLQISLDQFLEKNKKYFVQKNENVYVTGVDVHANDLNNGNLTCVRGEVIDEYSIRLITDQTARVSKDVSIKICKGYIVLCDLITVKGKLLTVDKLTIISRNNNNNNAEKIKKIEKIPKKNEKISKKNEEISNNNENISTENESSKENEIIRFLMQRLESKNGMIPYNSLTGHLTQVPHPLEINLEQFLKKHEKYFIIKNGSDVYLTGVQLPDGNINQLSNVHGEVIDKKTIRLVTNEIVTVPKEISCDINIARGDIVLCDVKKSELKVTELKILEKCSKNLEPVTITPIREYVSHVISKGLIAGVIKHGKKKENNILFFENAFQSLFHNIQVNDRVICDAEFDLKNNAWIATSVKHEDISKSKPIDKPNLIDKSIKKLNDDKEYRLKPFPKFVNDEVERELCNTNGIFVKFTPKGGVFRFGKKQEKEIRFDIDDFYKDGEQVLSLEHCLKIGDLVKFDAVLEEADVNKLRWKALLVWTGKRPEKTTIIDKKKKLEKRLQETDPLINYNDDSINLVPIVTISSDNLDFEDNEDDYDDLSHIAKLDIIGKNETFPSTENKQSVLLREVTEKHNDDANKMVDNYYQLVNNSGINESTTTLNHESSLSNSIKEVNEENEEIGEENGEIDKDNREIDEENKEIDDENGEINKENKEIGKKNGEINKGNKEIDEENGEIDEESQEIDDESGEIDKENEEIDEESEEIDEESEEIDDESGEIDKENEEIDKKIEKVDEKIEEIDENKELNTENDECDQNYDWDKQINTELFSCRGTFIELTNSFAYVKHADSGLVRFTAEEFYILNKIKMKAEEKCLLVGDLLFYDAVEVPECLLCRWHATNVRIKHLEENEHLQITKQGQILSVTEKEGLISFGNDVYSERIFFTINSLLNCEEEVSNLKTMFKAHDVVNVKAQTWIASECDKITRCKWIATCVWIDNELQDSSDQMQEDYHINVNAGQQIMKTEKVNVRTENEGDINEMSINKMSIAKKCAVVVKMIDNLAERLCFKNILENEVKNLDSESDVTNESNVTQELCLFNDSFLTVCEELVEQLNINSATNVKKCEEKLDLVQENVNVQCNCKNGNDNNRKSSKSETKLEEAFTQTLFTGQIFAAAVYHET